MDEILFKTRSTLLVLDDSGRLDCRCCNKWVERIESNSSTSTSSDPGAVNRNKLNGDIGTTDLVTVGESEGDGVGSSVAGKMLEKSNVGIDGSTDGSSERDGLPLDNSVGFDAGIIGCMGAKVGFDMRPLVVTLKVGTCEVVGD